MNIPTVLLKGKENLLSQIFGSGKSRVRTIVVAAVLVVWATLLTFILALMMVGHWYSLPIPDGDDLKLAKAVDESRSFGDMGKWYGAHFLYGQCSCSERIVDHIISRDELDNVREKIFLVDGNDEWESKIEAAGIPYKVISHDELKNDFNITSAPLFVVAAPDASLQYVGGYTERKQGYAIKDEEILRALINEKNIKTIPLFGCAVAKSLQKILDPMGLKYRF